MSALPTTRMGANISDTVSYKQSLNPYPDGLPDSVSVAWNNRMKEFFGLFLKHSNIITRVTAWGVTDGDSWKNNFPVPGRVDYPYCSTVIPAETFCGRTDWKTEHLIT